MVTFGIKLKTFPSSYHMSLAVIPVPQVQFQPSPPIWKGGGGLKIMFV